MSIERKNVMESIAKFQLNDNEGNVADNHQSVPSFASEEPIDAAKEELKKQPKASKRGVSVSPKYIGLIAIVCLIISTIGYVFTGSHVEKSLVVSNTETAQGNQDIIALKADIAMMQATMNAVLQRLDSVASAEKLNQIKQKHVDQLVLTLTKNNGEQDNYFGQELAKLTQWQKQYQQQQLAYLEEQKRQLANLEVDVEKLNNDAVSHNYANKFTNWQADVETIKEQQIQINNLLLDLQTEYIKLNQYQLHQQPAVTQNIATGN